MTFAGAHLAGIAFSTVEFDGGSSTTTFTLASNGRVAQTITIRGVPGTTTLTTSGTSLPITTNTRAVRGGGSPIANASILTALFMSTASVLIAAVSTIVAVNLPAGL